MNTITGIVATVQFTPGSEDGLFVVQLADESFSQEIKGRQATFFVLESREEGRKQLAYPELQAWLASFTDVKYKATLYPDQRQYGTVTRAEFELLPLK